jgi:hypothetical protein
MSREIKCEEIAEQVFKKEWIKFYKKIPKNMKMQIVECNEMGKDFVFKFGIDKKGNIYISSLAAGKNGESV